MPIEIETFKKEKVFENFVHYYTFLYPIGLQNI